MTRRDFYALVVPRFLENDLPDYWSLYATGKITHFEAMRSIFSHIRTTEENLRETVREMETDPRMKESVERLRLAGWEIEVVSAGCRWYIDQVLEEAGVELTVHASEARFVPGKGLLMELSAGSPYASQETGVDKESAVRDALARYSRVAFAGNGPPDLGAALLVDADLRFARGWLAKELKHRDLGFRRFEWWGEIAAALI